MGHIEPDKGAFMSDTADTTEPTVATEPAAAEPKATDKPDTGTKDWQAEAEKWKSFARKHEESAKANADKAKRLDEFEESQKSEQQKLADQAAEAKAEAAKTAGELAQMKAAVKHGLSEEDLELLGTHGTPEEIEQRAERLAARLKVAGEAKPKPDFGAGDRGGDVTATNFDAQIADAQKRGDNLRVISLRQQKAAAASKKP